MSSRNLRLLTAACGLALACSSAPSSLPDASSAPSVTDDGASVAPGDLGPAPFDAEPTGWAAVAGLGLETTTGGLGGPTVTVRTTAELAAEAKRVGPLVILLDGVMGDGTRITLDSDRTLIGLPGAELRGGLKVSGGSNIIVRNLKIVGNNCEDSPGDCSAGADAVSIGNQAHHVWVDHCDISDGSDGNLDVNGGADLVTISWTKFSYSGERPGGHQFSNLVGSSDNEPDDVGRLRVSYHHDWWAEHVHERMPRVRYGQVHVFNNLYTAAGGNYCVGLGFFANILTEANYFLGVRDPIESAKYANEQSVIASRDNVYVNSPGRNEDRGDGVFAPPYAYTLDEATDVRGQVESGAGVCPPRFEFVAEPIPSCRASGAELVSAP